MSHRIQFGFCLLVLSVACVPCVRAQSGGTPDQTQPPQQTQQPAGPEQPIGAESQTQENNSADANTIPAIVTPDTEIPPLSGVLLPSFGVPIEHSYIQPRFDFQSAWSSNGEYSADGNPAESSAMQTILGGVTIQKVGRRNELEVDYQGGRSFFSNGAIPDSTIQNFGLTDKWIGMRWSGTLADQMSYSSDPIFGAGIGSTSLSQTGVNIQPVFSPGQSVIVPRTPTLNNTTAAEADYQMSLRTSLTFVGTYSFLHYYGPGLINSGATNAQFGYNYRLTARDTIAGIYRFGLLNFSGRLQSITQNVIEFSYGRTFGQRWKLQVSGGPNIALIHQKTMPTQNYFSWTLTTNLSYQAGQRTTVSANYTHALTGGAGAFLGGTNDSLNTSVTYQFSRNWTGNLNAGYMRTATLPIQTTIPANAIDTLAGGAGITRQVGKSFSLGLTYAGYYQVSGKPICTTPSCGTNLNYQNISVVFGWHPVAVPID